MTKQELIAELQSEGELVSLETVEKLCCHMCGKTEYLSPVLSDIQRYDMNTTSNKGLLCEFCDSNFSR